jgi:SAM-dependent methyltransferase
MNKKRTQFQGVLNILSFNRHYYTVGFGTVLIFVVSRSFFAWPEPLFMAISLAILYGLLMPLLVSAYVYDFSGYYEFDWLNEVIAFDLKAEKIVNINAGFDETSFIIKDRFPSSQLDVFDFYDVKRHTESAIKRARKVSLVYPNTRPISPDAIPLKEQSVDIIFLLSAAHEIRRHIERVNFLKECHRTCRPGGSLIMVEHLRDFPNFLAFSVGFTHFFSRKAWKKAIHEAGFSSCEESKYTPFMSIFKCKP